MPSVLEKIVDERVGQTLVGTVSVAVDRMAEGIAREAPARRHVSPGVTRTGARSFAKALGPTTREWQR
ncbi:MAG: hypothetical protein DMG61_20435 [Acidobacteria bacterium]|nr:MAG: hypothetical protein DMG61_20435 [Acidobacteriota bacterium]